MESRQTFHKKLEHEAWQFQIRKQKELDWINSGRDQFWKNINLDLKAAKVRPVSRATAEKIILEYEWLGDMAVTSIYYGIFFDIYCGGVICINPAGATINSGKMFGVKHTEVSYFARGACPFWTPKGTASKLLSFALKLEKARGSKVAVSFADSDAGEYGTVYQATNWIALGYSTPMPQYALGRKVLDHRTWSGMAHKSGFNYEDFQKKLKDAGWKKQKANRKFRYAFIMADEPEKSRIYNKIKHLITPYPKRSEVL